MQMENREERRRRCTQSGEQISCGICIGIVLLLIWRVAYTNGNGFPPLNPLGGELYPTPRHAENVTYVHCFVNVSQSRRVYLPCTDMNDDDSQLQATNLCTALQVSVDVADDFMIRNIEMTICNQRIPRLGDTFICDVLTRPTQCVFWKDLNSSTWSYALVSVPPSEHSMTWLWMSTIGLLLLYITYLVRPRVCSFQWSRN